MKLFKPIMPTEEQLINSATIRFSALDGVKLEDFNEVLKSHTYPFEYIPIPKNLVKLTLDLDEDRGMTDEVVKLYELILDHIPEVKTECFFAKLNTRSPKDVVEDCKFHSIKDMVEAISYSMRTFEDLCYLYHIDKAALIIRSFIEWLDKYEWRVFVKDKVVVGISQYFYDQNFIYMNEEYGGLESSMRDFVNEIVIPNMSVDSFVIDLVADGINKPMIIEANPWGLSDPCLFERYENLDGSFKVNLA